VGEYNPYAAPEVAAKGTLGVHGHESGCWQDGADLVMSKDAELPDRCIKCNAPAEGYRLKRNLSWHSPWWFLLIFVSLLVYVIVALCIRKRATIWVGLCPEHRAARQRTIRNAWLFGAVTFCALIGSLLVFEAEYTGMLMGLGTVLVIVAACYGIIGARTVVVKRIDDRFVWLQKVPWEYQAGFPEWMPKRELAPLEPINPPPIPQRRSI
jgi:hypothetical protein